jgi:transposase
VAPPKKYPDELRERALRLYRDSDPKPPIKHLATQLGIQYEALRTWIRKDETARGVRPGDLWSQTLERAGELNVSEAEELRQLRKENAELRRANEILKAASAFFAQEIDPTRRR